MKKAISILLSVAAVAIFVIYFFFPSVVLEVAIATERSAADLEEKKVKVGEHNMVYLEGGTAGKEVLLLIHGFGGDKDNWTRFSKHLARQYHIFAPDLPGFGESDRLHPAMYDIASQVKRVYGFADAVGLKSFHIAGNSMGGHISAAFAHAHPEMVKTLGLFNNGGVTAPNPSEYRRTLAETGENILLAKSEEDFDRIISTVFEKVPPIPGPIKSFLAARAVKNQVFNGKVGEVLRSNPLPLEPLLPRIKTRTLVLWGDKDRILDVSAVDVIKAKLPKEPTVVIMKDCGHTPMIERPLETAQHYLKFLGEG